MNRCKPIIILILYISLFAAKTFAQEEILPQYPGGTQAFNKFILKNLKYPEVAQLIGLSGKVNVSFIIEKDGKISTVIPISCLGAGCESEAARVIGLSGKWIPGIQYGMPVRVQYTIPISFGITMDGSSVKIRLKDLKNSDYNFAFYIKGKAYSIDDAAQILGKEFDSSCVVTAEPYDDAKFKTPGKKAVYLIIMKDS